MALSTSTTARWTILSSNVAMPSGRSRPSAFEMYALRDGLARYVPLWTLSVQVLEFPLQAGPVGPPRHIVHARGSLGRIAQ